MGDFRRTRSKVWWSNYFQDEDEPEQKQSSLGRTGARRSWRQPAVVETNSNRNSSSSPSSGSQKSQDSGFSDSESSSSPSSCASSTDTRNSSGESQITAFELTKAPATPGSGQHTPVNRIPRPTLIKNRRKEEAAESISHYLADCYFPVPTAATVASSELPSSCTSPPASPGDRTCFIVDELPKRPSEPASPADRSNLDSSSETSSSPSLSSLEEYKVDDTVRCVEEKKDCDEDQPEELSSEPATPLPCITVDLLKAECRLSNLDLSHLPEPTHTSTPKKEESSVQPSRKCKIEAPVEEPTCKM